MDLECEKAILQSIFLKKLAVNGMSLYSMKLFPSKLSAQQFKDFVEFGKIQ